MKIFTKIFHQTFWQILGKIVTSLSTFIILGLVARNYGESGVGIFTLAMTYLGIFYLFSDFGFNAHVLRRIKNRSVAKAMERQNQELRIKQEWQKLLGTRIIWSIVLVIVAVGLLPFWPFSTPQFNTSVLFGSLAIIASGVFVSCSLIFQSKLRYDLSVLASSIGIFFSLGLFLYFTSINLPIPYLLLAHLGGWIVIALFAYQFAKIGLPVFNAKYAYDLFKQSWPVAATLVLNVVYFRADSFMVVYFKGTAEAGIYNIAYSVFQSALVLPGFIMNAYYPLMLHSLKGIKTVGLGLLIFAFLAVSLTIILSEAVIKILTGQGFSGSVQSLQILSLGFPAYFISALFMYILVLKGKYKPMLIIYAAGLVFNLTANFIYIPKFSFLAASWITVISEYMILLMQIFLLRGIIFRWS